MEVSTKWSCSLFYMDSYNKFIGCDRIFCVKPWAKVFNAYIDSTCKVSQPPQFDFKVGQIYQCKISTNNIPCITIFYDGGYYDFYSAENIEIIAECFQTLAEHRQSLLENLIT